MIYLIATVEIQGREPVAQIIRSRASDIGTLVLELGHAPFLVLVWWSHWTGILLGHSCFNKRFVFRNCYPLGHWILWFWWRYCDITSWRCALWKRSSANIRNGTGKENYNDYVKSSEAQSHWARAQYSWSGVLSFLHIIFLCYSYLFTTKRFPKTWPKARGPQRPTCDLLIDREQARWVTSKSVTGHWDSFDWLLTKRIRFQRIFSWDGSLALVAYVCLGHFWWPLWWPQTNRVPWKANEAPGAFGYLWLSKRGTKGTTVVVLVADRSLTIASVRLCVCCAWLFYRLLLLYFNMLIAYYLEQINTW